jgi:hypothetical protein
MQPQAHNEGESAGKPSRWPIMLSLMVCPGLGQMLQKRKAVGVAFVISFLLCFVIVIALMMMSFVAFFSLVDDLGGSTEQFEQALHTRLVLSLSTAGIAILLYFINMVDVYMAYQRSLSQWRAERLRETMASVVEESSDVASA